MNKSKRMKKISSMLSVLLLLMVFGYSNAVALELVTLQYPPYEYLENGEVKGVAVEIVQEVFTRMNKPITITVHPWDRSSNILSLSNLKCVHYCF